jgi:hypothetical protein
MFRCSLMMLLVPSGLPIRDCLGLVLDYAGRFLFRLHFDISDCPRDYP